MSESASSGSIARIDVHHHVSPPMLLDWMAERGYYGTQVKAWSPDLLQKSYGSLRVRRGGVEESLRLMQQLEIDRSILSVPAAPLHLGSDDEAASMARRINQYVADLVRDRPDRFGFFARLPLPYVDSALRELTYALDTLNADGIVINANSGGMYPGDPRLAPLMAELDRRGVVVFVHPARLENSDTPMASFIADFLLDTTRAAVDLVRSGVIGTRRNIKFILAHAGGFVPYAAHRLAHTTPPVEPYGHTPQMFLNDLRTFWFDTALSASPATFPTLLAFASPDRILYGSDFPYAPGDTSAYFTEQLDTYPDLDGSRWTAINRSNAVQLLKGS